MPDKKAFYSELYLKDITNKDYTHAQKVLEEIKLENLADDHKLYVQSDKLLLADVFENFRNVYWNIWTWYCSFFVCTRISMARFFKKDWSKIRIINSLLMVEKGIRGEICHAIHRDA